MAERPGRLSDLPLFRWGTERRAARARRRRRLCRVALFALGLALVAGTIASPPAPRLVWNASASAPIGLYGVTPGAPIRPGDMVIARTPAGARDLAARRRYLPANVPLIKRVVAIEHDTVCAFGAEIHVNGHRIAERLPADGRGRAMPRWNGCHLLGKGELFLLMDQHSASFDGRYFGMTTAEDVIGRAHLLWAR